MHPFALFSPRGCERPRVDPSFGAAEVTRLGLSPATAPLRRLLRTRPFDGARRRAGRIAFLSLALVLTGTAMLPAAPASTSATRASVFHDRVHEVVAWRSAQPKLDDPQSGVLIDIAAKLALGVDAAWCSHG